MNPIMQGLMSQLQRKNPNGFNVMNNLLKNGGNPDSFMKQLLGNMSSEQKQMILNQAKSYGCPDEFLSNLQNMR